MVRFRFEGCVALRSDVRLLCWVLGGVGRRRKLALKRHRL